MDSHDPPQHIAAKADPTCIESVKLLLERGADPNISNRSGHKPLHELLKNYTGVSLEAVNLLLNHGDVRLRIRGCDWPPLVWASRRSPDIFKAVLMKCPTDIINWPATQICSSTVLTNIVRCSFYLRDLENIKLMFKVCSRYVDLRHFEATKTLLIEAVENYSHADSLRDIVQLLLEYNIDPDAKNYMGDTALHRAVYRYYDIGGRIYDCGGISDSDAVRVKLLTVINELLKAGATVCFPQKQLRDRPSPNLLSYVLALCPKNLEDCPLLKLSVKHTLLQAFDEDFGNVLPEHLHDKFNLFPWLRQHYHLCVQEILLMKSVSLEDGCSLFEFVRRVSLKLSVENSEGEVLCAVSRDHFNIYKDLIQSYFSEDALLHFIQDHIQVFFKGDSWLNAYCMHKITSFLLKDDLFNFICASFPQSFDGSEFSKHNCEGRLRIVKDVCLQ